MVVDELSLDDELELDSELELQLELKQTSIVISTSKIDCLHHHKSNPDITANQIALVLKVIFFVAITISHKAEAQNKHIFFLSSEQKI